MTEEKRDPIPELARRRVALLDQYFFNRRDQVAALMGWGKPHPIMGLDNLPGLLLGHVLGPTSPHAGVAKYLTRDGAVKAQAGPFRVGSYTPDPDGNTRWLCLDFDGAGHADALADPAGAVRLTYANFAAAGLPAYIERSGGGKGYHLWVLFSQPMPAQLARRLARTLAPIDLRLARGGVAVARNNRGVECFPKCVRLKTPSQLGNLVWLPWYHGAPAGANLFYREAGGGLEPYEPEDFETVAQAAVEQALAATGAADPADEEVEKFLRRASKGEEGQRPPSSAWREWKERALARLELDRVYGPWLTGQRSGEGWLQCRDPESPSGSESRSGNVADGTGVALRGTFRSWRTEECCSIFDFMTRHGLAADFLGAARQIAEWTGIPLPARGGAGKGHPRPPGTRGKPVIVTNQRQLEDIITEARHVIEEANRRIPFLFRQDRRFLRLVESSNGVHAEDVGEQTAYGFLVRLADWVRRSEEGDEPVAPSHELSRDLVVNPPANLHSLEMIVTSPVFTAARKLLQQPGYDRDSGIWYWQTPAMAGLTVPSAPTAEEVQTALSLLLGDLLVDFPFPTPADRAHALAALLLPFMKSMIQGLCPIHLVEAPAIGSGKSLLAKLVHLLAAGSSAPITTMGRDDEETRKKITSLLATGARIVIIDNVAGGISSSSLAAAITGEIWKDRWLGTQEMPELPNHAIWFFTGNNPDLSLEIARRCVRIRIESPDEKPWLRKHFKHDPIEDWARDHRGPLVQAILTLIQAWVNAGAPRADVTMGSFQQWAKTVGGLLQFLDVPGFLDNRDEMYDAADARENEWQAFVPLWWEEFRATPVSASDLRTLADRKDALAACRGPLSEASQTVRLGKEVRRLRGRRFGDLRIVTGRPARDKANRWALVRVTDEHDDSTPSPQPGGDSSCERTANAPQLFPSSAGGDRETGHTGSAARRVGPETRRVGTEPSAVEDRLGSAPRRDAEGAEGHPGVTQCAPTHTPHAHVHAHDVREGLGHPPHPPRPSARQETQASPARGVEAATLRAPSAHPPRTGSELDLVDLNQFAETSVEEAT